MDLIFQLVDTLSITTEVYEELSRCTPLIKPLATVLQREDIEIVESPEYTDLQDKYPERGMGELSVIASHENRIVFIEDRDAEKAAQREGVQVFNLPELLLACKKRDILEKDELIQIIDQLREKDGYVLKKSVEKALIDE